MTRNLALAFALSSFAASVFAQSTSIPLFKKRFDYDKLPYKVDTDDGDRGRQFGYNRCNSTTEGQASLCQTSLINSIEDFCLWGPPEPNSVIGNTEGESVAWCTKPGRGTRLIPQGALTGVQFMRTPDYVQVVGFIKQDLIYIQKDDGGGEMDPHGADQRGNPLGGVVYSNAFPSNGGNKDHFQQVIEWHNFMGSNMFCFKACDPAGPNAADFCEHIYDRIGCSYNAPAAYKDGVFESCVGENQDFPGVYTDASGATQTYKQPPEAAGEIQTMPYTPRVPASSSCTSFASTAIFTASVSGVSSAATSSSSASVTQSGSQTSVTTTPKPTSSIVSRASSLLSSVSSSSTSSSTSSPNAGSTRASASPLAGMAIVGVLSVALGGGLMVLL